MHFSLTYARQHLAKFTGIVTHNGERLSYNELKHLVDFGIRKGYESSSQLSDVEIDAELAKLKQRAASVQHLPFRNQ